MMLISSASLDFFFWQEIAAGIKINDHKYFNRLCVSIKARIYMYLKALKVTEYQNIEDKVLHTLNNVTKGYCSMSAW